MGEMMRGIRGRVALAALLLNGCLVWPGLAANAPGDAPGTIPGSTAVPSWPHAMNVHGANVVVYQPQAISWPEHQTLTARAAVSITPPGAPAPILGTIELTLATRTDAATDNVYFSDPHLVSSHFPTLDTAQAAHVEEQIRNGLPDIQTQPVPLQSVLLSLKDQAQPAGVPLENQPPEIFSSDKPASLVIFDGEPVLAPVGQTGLSFAVNTNWDVFSDGKDWYLLNNGLWMSAKAYGGPYQPITSLPPAFSKIPADKNFEGVRKAIPPKPGRPAVVPVIFVSTKPAEIIVTNGPPQFVPVTGTSLQSVKNTTSALYLQPSSGEFYLLASGRWFSAHGLGGPWQFATDHLPPDFALIPPESPQAHVLASVPGTSQAQLAVLQAQVPRQATLKKDAARPTVVYAGQPQFKPIPGTPMMYAVNTSFEVIETGGHYYVCYQGAWFAGPSPNGPWVLAESVPQVIYTIPPSSPLYNVTYVKVYGATPAAVTFGYTSGYMMGFVSAGVMVYGTGYYYPPVVMPGPVPIYYPYPYSYTGNVTYNTTTGAWTHGGTVYGPYGTATGGTYYNPSTGASGRGGAVYGPNGGAGGFSYYNPSNGSYARGSASWSNGSGSANASYYNAHTGVSGSTNQNANPYSRWGSSTFTGANQTVNTRSGSNAQGSAGAFQSSTGAKGAGYSGVNGNKGGAVKTQNGDVYAGHDGNVYQHGSSGWSQWNNGAWQPVTPPSNATKPQTTQASAPSNSSNTPQNRQQASQASPQSSQMAHQTAQNRQQSRQTSTQAAQHSSRQTMGTSSYQQLEQDRQARFAGSERSGGSGGGGGGRFGGGGGGLGGGGGGHFRR
jgi:hypothetical protein